jgi:hypothetical protein
MRDIQAVECPRGVKSTLLAVNRSHPVYPDQRTFPEKSACRKGANGGSKWPSMSRELFVTLRSE